MPDIHALIKQTEDHLELVHTAGVETERQIAELDERLKQLKHERVVYQARLATLKELIEPEVSEPQTDLEQLESIKNQMPPEVFEQVKNVLADGSFPEPTTMPAPKMNEGHQPKEDEVIPEPPKNARPSLKQRRH